MPTLGPTQVVESDGRITVSQALLSSTKVRSMTHAAMSLLITLSQINLNLPTPRLHSTQSQTIPLQVLLTPSHHVAKYKGKILYKGNLIKSTIYQNKGGKSTSGDLSNTKKWHHSTCVFPLRRYGPGLLSHSI